MSIWALLVVASQTPGTIAVAQPAPLDNYAHALAFVFAAYPELRNRALGFALADNYWHRLNAPIHELRSFALMIGEGPDPGVEGGEHAPVLTVHFEFSEGGCLEEATAAPGEFTHLQKARAIEQLIATHDGIGRNAVGDALSAVGARFAPSKELELRVRVRETLDRLGVVLERPVIKSVEWIQDDTAQWSVVFVARCNRKAVSYNAVFEPFDGKLLALRKRTAP